MTRQDIEALREMDRWLSTQCNRTNGSERSKRFGLATWVLGWGLYKTYSTIRHIKDNIRTLCCILIQESKTWHKVLRTLY